MVDQCTESGSEAGYYDMVLSTYVGRMSCERATVKAMKDKLVTYKNLRDGLAVSREEFAKASEWEDVMNSGLMALRWTKASCDAFISMAASASSVVLPTSTAGLVKSGYKLSAAIALAGSTAANGGKVDKVVLLRDLKDGALGVTGHYNKSVKLASLPNLQANIVIDAIRGDSTAVMLKATGGQLAESAKLAGAWAKQLNKAGAVKASKWTAFAAEIATAGIAFQVSLTKASDEYFKNQDETRGRRSSIHRMLAGQLNRIETRIIQLETGIDDCFETAEDAI